VLLTMLAAEGPNSVHIPADPNEVYWASAAFFLVVGLLYWKGWPAFARVLNNRTAGIRADLEVAERQRQEAEAQLTAQQAEVGDVGTERQRLLAEAAETAERLKVDLVARARTEAEAMRARALTDIENQRNQALSDLRSEVARLTRGAAEAVIRENLDASSQDQLIDSYIERVRQLS
jgi:F-type H+-transporting ATPase subunit b